MRERICGIYKITNKINKKIYIGQSVNILDRWNDHKKNRHKKSTILQNSIKKYGIENFEFKIIKICNPKELNELEVFYIKKYNSCILFENHNGYNMTTGGDGSYNKPPVKNETKLKIKKTLTGKKVNLTEEGLNKKRQMMLGENNINSKAVLCDGIEYKTIEEFSMHNNLNPTTVGTWIRGKRKMPTEWYNKNLMFKDYNTNIEERVFNNYSSNAVVCGDKLFKSVGDCAEYYNFNKDTLRCYVNGKRKMKEPFLSLGLRKLTQEEINENIRKRNFIY